VQHLISGLPLADVGFRSHDPDGVELVRSLAEAAKELLPMNARTRSKKAQVRRQKKCTNGQALPLLLLFPFSFCLLASIAVQAQELQEMSLPAPASGEAATNETSESEAAAAPAVRRFSTDGKPLLNLVFAPGTQPSIDLVLAQIKAQTGITVTPMGAARGQPVPAPLLKDTTIEDALKWICAQKDWVWAKEGPNYIISDRPYYEKNVLSKTVVQRVIVPRNIPAADAAKAVERMKSPVGDIQFDARTNQVFVTDILPIVEAIERTIKLLDQKVFLRVFTLKHADPKTVLDFLQPYKSPPGRLELIPKMRQIIAEDTYENIQRMEVMVDLLDRGPEMRIYDLNNIDFEGKSIQDIQDYLDKEILTEGAYLKFDPQNGVMILIDLPSVHEKVQKILEAVDKPARQVYIQAEVVETNFDHTFKIGTDFTWADDLLVQAPTTLATGTGATGAGTVTGTGTGQGVPTQQAGATPQGTAATGGGTSNLSLGFTDLAAAAQALHERYPVVTAGSSGIALDYLSRHARLAFSAVMTDNETRLLAQPRVLVKNRQPADITDGGSISYPTTTYYGGGYGYGQGTTGYNPYVPSVSPGSVPIGLTLTVDPSIMNNGLIELRVSLMNQSGTSKTSKLGGQDYTLVDTTNQTLNTILVIPDGQTRMIGGTIRNIETENVSGIPYLKDIPVIGPLVFGNKDTKTTRRTLLMFITPSVVQEQIRRYVTPPDESEMTPPTFYEQASWSATAVKRAVEEAVKETEEKYPGFRFPGREEEELRKPEGIRAPTVRLEHEETTGPAELQLPPLEERVTTIPKRLLERKPVELEPRMPPPPAPPVIEPKGPPPPSSPTLQPKTAAPPTTATTETKKPALPTSPSLTQKAPAPTPRPTPAVKPNMPLVPTTTKTLETRKSVSPTSPTVAPKLPPPPTSPTVGQKAPPAAPAPQPKLLKPIAPHERPTTATFPSTGTVMFEAGPPRILLSSRKPADLPLPAARATTKRSVAVASGAAGGEEGLEPTSYEVTVLGEGGRSVTALPSGEYRESPALGTVQVPMETLAVVATPTPPPAPTPAMIPPGIPPGAIPPGMRVTRVSGQPPPGPAPAVTPLRPMPTRPVFPTYGTPAYSATPYGIRPPIMPPNMPPGYYPGYYPGGRRPVR